MPGRSPSEIHTSRPFSKAAEETFLQLQRTADWLLRGVEEILREAGLTHAQYNVLRILAGAGPDGLTCSEVAARMLTRDPDITRLLDRMEKGGYVKRGRSAADRRVVQTFLTPAGATTLRALKTPVREAIRKSLAPLGRAKLERLTGLLDEIRIQMEQDASK